MDGIDADGSGDFQASFSFLRHQNHPAQMMIRRRPERQPIFPKHQHTVN
jgi:hypothetical protein